MTSASFADGDLSFGRYRRDRPNFGLSDPNPLSPMVMTVVTLRSRPAHIGWHDGREIAVPAHGRGSLTCLDLREQWSMDLNAPFGSFHAFIPLTAFDDIADELDRPRINGLNTLISVEHRDETMLGLAQALNPAFGRASQATRLFADYVFAAMVTHLAVTYGGMSRGDVQVALRTPPAADRGPIPRNREATVWRSPATWRRRPLGSSATLALVHRTMARSKPPDARLGP